MEKSVSETPSHLISFCIKFISRYISNAFDTDLQPWLLALPLFEDVDEEHDLRHNEGDGPHHAEGERPMGLHLQAAYLQVRVEFGAINYNRQESEAG